MIDLVPLRPLTLSPAYAEVAGHISAASGIAVVGSCLYVVADDELHLGIFDLDTPQDGSLLRVFPGELPTGTAARKPRKPDLEALVRLPPFPAHPAGALLALASGSRPNRLRGVLIGLDEAGALRTTPRAIDLSVLYAPLLRRFPALNIEGAVVCAEQLVLLQRASGGHPENALIRIPLAPLLQSLALDDQRGLPELPTQIEIVDLGHIDGTPLGFTDAAALADGRLVFSAAAERTDDTYHDGACVGAAIGVLDIGGRVAVLQRVNPVHKIEGIAARQEGSSLRLLLVSDADDRSAPGLLFSAVMALDGN